MNESLKRRNIDTLGILTATVNDIEELAEEVVRLLIISDDRHRLPPQVIDDTEIIKSSAEAIRGAVDNISVYVNRKQAPHRL